MNNTITVKKDGMTGDWQITNNTEFAVILIRHDKVTGAVGVVSDPDPLAVAERIANGHSTTPDEDYVMLVRSILKKLSDKMDKKKKGNIVLI